MMNSFSGALNTKGFSSSIQYGQLPPQDHLTYQGLFNQIKFPIGKKTKKNLDFHCGFARYQNQQNLHNKQLQQYLALFMKGSSDGQPRDNRILNSIIILDISGSMGGSLSRKTQINKQNRLDLCKQAIKMFVSKLRNNDSFGLVLFNNVGTTFYPSTKKIQINMQQLFNRINTITPNGGTTLLSGINQGTKIQNNIYQIMLKILINRIVQLCQQMYQIIHQQINKNQQNKYHKLELIQLLLVFLINFVRKLVKNQKILEGLIIFVLQKIKIYKNIYLIILIILFFHHAMIQKLYYRVKISKIINNQKYLGHLIVNQYNNIIKIIKDHLLYQR